VSKCFMCPRECGTDRSTGLGVCGVPESIAVAKIMLHKWEEPCICSGAGAGAIFFSGCNLHCLYCQNCKISNGKHGNIITENDLVKEILSLSEQGASCIDLVTPTHYSHALVRVLERVKPSLNIPIVWNSSGYEKISTLKDLDGLVDIYMPDIKYFSPDISMAYSNARDYFEVAAGAVCEMLRQVGPPQFDGSGNLLRGVILRHLVLPGCSKDSVELLTQLSQRFSPKDVILSLMSQYTPDFYMLSYPEHEHKNLTRRITEFEYTRVLSHAQKLGFDGYLQERSSANSVFTPDF